MVIVILAIFFVIFWISTTEIYEIVLTVIGIIALAVLVSKTERNRADKVVKALLESEEAVYKKVAEHTGYSVGWGWRSGRDYYRYKEVIDHYDCTFSVIYEDGKRGTIRCRKGDAIYRKLMRKVDKP